MSKDISVQLTLDDLHEIHRALFREQKKQTNSIQSYAKSASEENRRKAIKNLHNKKALCEKIFKIIANEELYIEEELQ